MRAFNLLTSSALLFCLFNVCYAHDDRAKALELQSAMRRELGSSSSSTTKPPTPKPPHPKKKHTTSSPTSSSTSTSGSTTSKSVAPKANSTNIKVSVAAAAFGSLIAAAFFHQKRSVVTELSHPLEGSIAKRVENFEKFAGPHSQNVRPSLDYNAMPDTGAMV